MNITTNSQPNDGRGRGIRGHDRYHHVVAVGFVLSDLLGVITSQNSV